MAPRGKKKQEPTLFTQTIPLPLLYHDPVALDADRHRNLTVAPSPGGYRFAATAHSIMLTAVEFAEACRDYPIIFYAADDGSITPLAMLGFQAAENLFVDETGDWKASYIPAYIRRYPFIPADTGTKEYPICIDQKFDGINIAGGQRLFDDNGAPTDYCRQVQAFLYDYQSQPAITSAFTIKLHELGLFRPMDANIQMKDGNQFHLHGLLIVDEESLAKLGDAAVQELFRKGYLGLIYTHLASLKNLARLIDLKATRNNQPSETACQSKTV